MDLRQRLVQIREGQSLISEAYYGKNEVLKKCEVLLQKALESNDGFKELKEVEKLLEKEFNFKKLVLSSLTSGIASTIPITTYKFNYIGKKIGITKTDTGIAFNSSDKVEAIIFVNLTTLSMIGLNGGEILAIILHEIGHSMRTILPSSQLISTIGAITFSLTIFPAIAFNFFGDKIIKLVEKIDSFKSRVSKLFDREVKEAVKSATIAVNNIRGSIYRFAMLFDSNKGKKFLSTIWDSIRSSLRLKKITPYYLSLSLSSMVYDSMKFKEEQLSDYISSVYGYGPELSSALSKMDINLKGIAIDNPISRLLSLPFNIVNLLFDPHPKNISRFKLIIQNLESELSKSINKDAYNDIKKDLNLIKKELQKYEEKINENKITNFDIIVYRKVITKILRGHDDVRALFFGLTPKDMELIDGLEELPVQIKEPETLQECHELMMSSPGFTFKQKNKVSEFLLH